LQPVRWNEGYRLDGEGQQLGAGFMAMPSVKGPRLSAAWLARVNPQTVGGHFAARMDSRWLADGMPLFASVTTLR
jgi:hypothetical protein